MDNITRTVYGSFLQTCTLLRLPFSKKTNSTLNEKFGIQSEAAVSIDEVPCVRYYAIGNGGHRNATGPDSTPITRVVQHRATDAALFRHLPFVLREPSDDLAGPDRAKYGLRREETWNGVRYIAYYLKRIPLSGVVAEMNYTAAQNGTSVTSPFQPDSSNLNPLPPELSPTGVNVVTGDYTVASARVSLALTTAEIAEVVNAAKVIYDDEAYAVVSEIALVSGIDRVVSAPGIGASVINFNEVICAQVVCHINTYFPLHVTNGGVELALDVGATEPLFSPV